GLFRGRVSRNVPALARNGGGGRGRDTTCAFGIPKRANSFLATLLLPSRDHPGPDLVPAATVRADDVETGPIGKGEPPSVGRPCGHASCVSGDAADEPVRHVDHVRREGAAEGDQRSVRRPQRLHRLTGGGGPSPAGAAAR